MEIQWIFSFCIHMRALGLNRKTHDWYSKLPKASWPIFWVIYYVNGWFLDRIKPLVLTRKFPSMLVHTTNPGLLMGLNPHLTRSLWESFSNPTPPAHLNNQPVPLMLNTSLPNAASTCDRTWRRRWRLSLDGLRTPMPAALTATLPLRQHCVGRRQKKRFPSASASAPL